jgi:hypothetical protein
MNNQFRFIEELKRIRVQESADMSALLKKVKRNKTILLRGLLPKDESTVNTFNESIFQKRIFFRIGKQDGFLFRLKLIARVFTNLIFQDMINRLIE